MNLDELRAVQNGERATDSLQALRDSFYVDVADYVESLREERASHAESAADPFADPEVSRLTDEIEMAEQVAEAIYERRVGKIVKQASLAAAGMDGDTEGLTGEEQQLHDDLVARIEENKGHVLDVLAGEAVTTQGATGPGDERDTTGTGTDRDPVSPGDVPPEVEQAAGTGQQAGSSTPTDDSPGVDAADLMGDTPSTGESTAANAQSTPDDSAAAADDAAARDDGRPTDDPAAGAAGEPAPDRSTERETVRITRDVGEIFGVDEHVYTLESDDVVTLPAENAAPLLEREAAEKLE